jgi:hypothetical protein
MSRTDWFVGLNGRARKYLEENGRWGKIQTLDDEGKIIREEPWLICEMGTKYRWVSMFGDEHPLRVFPLKNGKEVYEKVQADPWASGPNFFICLVDENDKEIAESLWTDEEIEEML